MSNPLILLLIAVRQTWGARAGVARHFRETPADVLRWVVDVTVSGKPILPKELSRLFCGAVDMDSKVPLLSELRREKRRVLQETACAANESGGRVVTRSVLDDRLSLVCGEAHAAIQAALASTGATMSDWVSAIALTHFFVQGEQSVEFAHQAFVDYLVAEKYVSGIGEDDQRHVHLTVDQAYLAFEIAGRNRNLLRSVAENVFAGISVDEVKTADIALIVLVGKHLADHDILHYIEWIREWCVGDELRDKGRGSAAFDKIMSGTVYARSALGGVEFDGEAIAWLGERGFAGLRLTGCSVEAPAGGLISAVGAPLDMTASVWTQCRLTDLRCEVLWRETTIQKSEVKGLDVTLVGKGGVRFVGTRFLGRNRIAVGEGGLTFQNCVAHAPLNIDTDSVERVKIKNCRADGGVWCRLFMNGVVVGELPDFHEETGTADSE